MTNEEKAIAFDKIQEAKELQKKKDRFYADRAKHKIDEMARVIKDNELEPELQDFSKSLEDYI